MSLRPRAVDELRAASAVGQGKLYQVNELLRARGLQTAQVLLTFFDMSARTHYLDARQTLRLPRATEQAVHRDCFVLA